jgi:predicted dehydrogenase
MKIGIIGFGQMGIIHGALLTVMNDVEIIGIADTSKFMLNAFKSLLPRVKYFDSYEKMFKKCDLDAVIIATPSFKHAEIAIEAAKRGLHVFIEKPLSSNLRQALDLYETIKDKEIITMVGFCCRYIPTIAKAKGIILNNLLGKVISVSAESYVSNVLSEQTGWRYNRNISGGGVLIDYTVHIIDLLYWYFGEVQSVLGQTRSVYSKDVEDEVNAELKFKNGVLARVNSSWSRPEYRKSYMKIVVEAEKGKAIITDQTLDIEDTKENESVNETHITYPELYQGYYLDIGGPLYSIQMQNFVESIKNGKQPESNVASGLYVQRIIDLIYRSADQKMELNLERGEKDAKY